MRSLVDETDCLGDVSAKGATPCRRDLRLQALLVLDGGDFFVGLVVLQRGNCRILIHLRLAQPFFAAGLRSVYLEAFDSRIHQLLQVQ